MASFSYDAVGRRASKTVNSSTTSYLYDGANVAQEITSGSTSTGLLTGGLDQVFSRTDSSGTMTPLRDGMGSVVALTDASGAVQTSYSYEPFGKTTVSGAVSSNSQKYTGREEDGTGLYYYRNRYYSPSLQRFISEDPIGLRGGINVYAYVVNNPVNLKDPSGLQAENFYLDFHQTAPSLGGRQKDNFDWFYYFTMDFDQRMRNLFKPDPPPPGFVPVICGPAAAEVFLEEGFVGARPGTFSSEDMALGVHEYLQVFKGNARIGTELKVQPGGNFFETILNGIDETVANGGTIRFNLDGVDVEGGS